MNGSDLDFSFSGVKTAVLNYVNGCQMKGEEYNKADIAASFQRAVTDVLVEHTMAAAKQSGMKKVALAGGVASNSALRDAMKNAADNNGFELFYPKPVLCTDNAAMIACAGYYDYMSGARAGYDLNAVPNLKLGER